MSIRWSLAIFSVCMTCGIGAFVAGLIQYFTRRGGRPRLYFLAGAFVAAAVGTAVNIAGLGSPAKVFNMLSHITSGYSLSLLGGLILAGTSLILLIWRDPDGVSNVFLYLIGVIAVLMILYGLGILYYRPSRAALHTVGLPLYLVFSSFAVAGYMNVRGQLDFQAGILLKVFRRLAFTGYLAALGSFVWHLAAMEDADKYLNVELLFKGELSFIFLGLVITAGVMVPLAVEIIWTFSRWKNPVLGFWAWAGILLGVFGFSIIMNTTFTVSSNMIV